MNELWDRTMSALRNRLSEESFNAWFAPIEFVAVDNTQLQLRIPNRFYADWINSHYADLLNDSLNDALMQTGGSPNSVQVQWSVDPSLQEKIATQPPPAPTATEVLPTATSSHRLDQTRDHNHAGPHAVHASHASSDELLRASEPWLNAHAPRASRTSDNTVGGDDLNPKYRFENFIVGPSNELAFAAAVAAGSKHGRRYNPLFIYGGVGLGKTHLVNAVGHKVLDLNPRARILYLSAERFTNEFIWALQNHKISEFREKYRSRCDVLLMDDIQFLAGRVQTQEEFFHTFNALYHSDKQIVVTSDVYPQQIGEMEERLISRFQWGLVADIQAPELDTRVAILRKKAEQEGIELPLDVAHFLAQTVKSNVRELEGTLLRLAVKAELMHRPIDLDFSREALHLAKPASDQATTVEDIQRAVCEFFNIRLADLKSHKRHRSVSFPRMVAMYLCRQRLNISYPELGDRFGGKDHTTVLSAVRKISALMQDQDANVQSAVDSVDRKLRLRAS